MTVHPPKTRQIQRAATSPRMSPGDGFASYTLRYDIVERDDPQKIHFAKWAPTLGFTPGLTGPSECLWYNQGFFA